jgi:DNA-binding response OmpR family regulator
MSHLSILPTLLRDVDLLADVLSDLGQQVHRGGAVEGFAGERVPVLLLTADSLTVRQELLAVGADGLMPHNEDFDALAATLGLQLRRKVGHYMRPCSLAVVALHVVG